MKEKKVTVREVKKALELAGVDINETFSVNSWNDKRKNGRRIKMPYKSSSTESIINVSDLDVHNNLKIMFPTKSFRVEDHLNRKGQYSYNSFVVHVKG
jgi:hypothetical protein|tara:strand:+ start:978 stop:1271 length:294 start_codon:yes stop_codon:yes gene_type:complete